MSQSTTSSCRKSPALVLFGLALVAGAPLAGQVDDPAIAQLQFNFTPPGARSLGLGGAFLALTSDATAAYTNPAGLTNLTQAEVSAEARSFGYQSSFTTGGRVQCVEIEGSDFGAPPCVDTAASGFGFDSRDGLIVGAERQDVNGLSFISYVHPIKDFRIAFFRHELVNFESRFRTEGAFVGVADDEPLSFIRLFPTDTSLNLEIENFGTSVAYKLGDFSLGIAANYYRFDIVGITDRYDLVIAPPFTASGQIAGPPLYESPRVFLHSQQSGQDEDLGVNVGFQWEASPSFRLAGSYRSGASFDYSYTTGCGPSDPFFCTQVPGLESGAAAVEARFNVPAIWGLGIAVRPIERLAILLDFNHVEYSALVEDFQVALSFLAAEDFSVDDADEIHLGLEYVFANLRNPISIRMGAWEDPAHQIRYVGGGSPNVAMLVEWAGANEIDDEIHYSAGLGFTAGENFGLDIAADFSELVDVLALSATYRF